jgi:hypothetical protein
VNDLESIIRGSAEHEPGEEWVPDWEDVLSRASGQPRPRPTFLSRRATAIGGLVAATLVLTLPGIGIGGRLKDLISGSRLPGIELRASVARPDGRPIGTVSLRTSRLFVAVSPRTGQVRPHPFVPRRSGLIPRGSGPLQPVPLAWTLDLKGAATVTSARIERVPGRKGQRLIAQLCAPCRDDDHGTIRLGRSALSALFDRATVAAVETSQGPARGAIRLATVVR